MNAPARTVRAIGTHCTGDPAGLVVGRLAKSFEPPGMRSRSAQVSAVVGWSHESSEPNSLVAMTPACTSLSSTSPRNRWG